MRNNPVAVIGTIIEEAPAAIAKVRRSPKRHRLLVGLREVVRMAGRVTLGPVWDAGEILVKKLK